MKYLNCIGFVFLLNFSTAFGEVINSLPIKNGAIVLSVSSNKTGIKIQSKNGNSPDIELVKDTYNLSLKRLNLSYSIFQKTYIRMEQDHGNNPFRLLHAENIGGEIYIIYTNTRLLMLERVIRIDNTYISVDSEHIANDFIGPATIKITQESDEILNIFIPKIFGESDYVQYNIKDLNLSAKEALGKN